MKNPKIHNIKSSKQPVAVEVPKYITAQHLPFSSFFANLSVAVKLLACFFFPICDTAFKCHISNAAFILNLLHIDTTHTVIPTQYSTLAMGADIFVRDVTLRMMKTCQPHIIFSGLITVK